MKKDKKWLSEEINELIDGYTSFGGHQHLYISKQNIDKLYQLIDQLDEPEKVVIPQFVADEFDYEKSAWYRGDETKDIPLTLQYAFENPGSDDFLGWVRENPEDYVMAVRNGYEIEKEKLYVVVLSNSNEKFGTYENVFLNKKDGVAFIDSCRLSINDIKKHSQFALTEKQIKDYDPRFMAFAVEASE